MRGKGGVGKGPAVWPRVISFSIAVFIAVLLSRADLRLCGCVSVDVPVKPMSKPCLSPWTMYSTRLW